MKFAVVTEIVPPSWSGQALLIRRLLAALDPDMFCLITRDQGPFAGEHTGRLQARHYEVRPLPRLYRRRSNKWVFAGFVLCRAVIGIGLRAIQIRRIVRREQCRAVVVFTGDFHDPPASLLASRSLRLPLYVYMCDYYSYREPYEPARRRLSPYIERIVVRKATGVICANETLESALSVRYGIKPTVIHHPTDLSLYRGGSRSWSVGSTRELRIVYSGTIYQAQLDAVANLLDGIDLLIQRTASLHVFSGQPESELRAMGLRGRLVVHPHKSPEAIAAAQEAADVLFLPLAFRSEYPEVIKTSAPMKLGDYLAAGGPILVHAPADAFVSEYCRRYECGLVVDDPDPAAIARAIEELASDTTLQERLIQNARARAVRDFSVEIARTRFAELLGLEPLDEVSRAAARGG